MERRGMFLTNALNNSTLGAHISSINVVSINNNNNNNNNDNEEITK